MPYLGKWSTMAVPILIAGTVSIGVQATQAEVFIKTVVVGNPGNDGEWSGESYGGNGPDRICGAVEYIYRIGTFEVTAGQYTEFLEAVAATDTYGLYNTSMADPTEWELGCNIQQDCSSGPCSYSVDPAWENRPVNHVSWGDAARFANWLHNGRPTGTLTGIPAQDAGLTEDGSYYLNGAMSDVELLAIIRGPDATWVIPSEDEWYKAAYHYNDGVAGDYYRYPASNDSVPGYVNDSGNLSGTGDPFIEGGPDPGNYMTYNGDGGTDGIGPEYYRTQVREWENSESPYGTFDQGGNVWEWNEAVLDGSSRCFRGGSINASGLNAAYRYGHEPTFEYFDSGFRVAKVSDLDIPTLSEWAVVSMILLLLVAGTIVYGRVRPTAIA